MPAAAAGSAAARQVAAGVGPVAAACVGALGTHAAAWAGPQTGHSLCELALVDLGAAAGLTPHHLVLLAVAAGDTRACLWCLHAACGAAAQCDAAHAAGTAPAAAACVCLLEVQAQRVRAWVQESPLAWVHHAARHLCCCCWRCYRAHCQHVAVLALDLRAHASVEGVWWQQEGVGVG